MSKEECSIGAINDEERLELIRRLDEDLDDYMDKLASNKKSDPNKEEKEFNFDKWSKELDQHPIFMKELKPNEVGEFPEAIQALQALKYDDDEYEDKISQAIRHKNEGNKHFKFRKYKWARDCYTNGIKVLCNDRSLNSILFANRAAANVRLRNLRSAIRDCAFALRFDEKNIKAVIRGAECLLELKYGKECIEWIDRYSDFYSIDENLASFDAEHSDDFKRVSRLYVLKKEAERCVEITERDRRKQLVLISKDVSAKKAMLAALSDRNLKLKPELNKDSSLFDWSEIEVNLPQMSSVERVRLDESGILHWPLLVQYPETGQTDLLTDCCEESTLDEIFSAMFEKSAPWDPHWHFRRDNVDYFLSLDKDENLVAKVLPGSTLKLVLSTSDYFILQGLPVIQVYTKTHVEKFFNKMSNNLFVLH